MIKKMKKKIEHEVLSLIPGITYSCVPSWYGSTMRDLKMDIIAPKQREGHKKCPLIVWFCGGAYRVMDRSVWMPEMMRFARMGYVVASVEYRTSNETCFPEPLIDGKAAVRYLKAHADDFCIDVDKICVMGESAGGTMASLIGLTSGNAEFEKGDFLEVDSSVHAVVDFYGLVDLTEDLRGEPSNDIPSWVLQDYLGVNYTKETAVKASAISYVTENTPPVLILHGGEDPTVPLAQSEAFYEKLRQKGVDSDFIVIEDASHGDEAFFQDDVIDMIGQFLENVWREE